MEALSNKSGSCSFSKLSCLYLSIGQNSGKLNLLGTKTQIHKLERKVSSNQKICIIKIMNFLCGRNKTISKIHREIDDDNADIDRYR